MKKFFNCLFSLGCSLIALCSCEAEQPDTVYTQRRLDMVSHYIEAANIDQESVLTAMRTVPRHLFVPAYQRPFAYENRALSIGHKQTISQPYVVALMTLLADVDESETVLEIGTGSGYQAAVLAEIAKEVYTIEYLEPLGLDAKKRLEDLGYNNVSVKIGDGYKGWPEHQPFDAIVVTAAIDHIPQPLIDQLNVGGHLVIPVGEMSATQELLLLEKNQEGQISEHKIIPVRFVPFLGPKQ